MKKVSCSHDPGLILAQCCSTSSRRRILDGDSPGRYVRDDARHAGMTQHRPSAHKAIRPSAGKGTQFLSAFATHRLLKVASQATQHHGLPCWGMPVPAVWTPGRACTLRRSFLIFLSEFLFLMSVILPGNPLLGDSPAKCLTFFCIPV